MINEKTGTLHQNCVGEGILKVFFHSKTDSQSPNRNDAVFWNFACVIFYCRMADCMLDDPFSWHD